MLKDNKIEEFHFYSRFKFIKYTDPTGEYVFIFIILSKMLEKNKFISS